MSTDSRAAQIRAPGRPAARAALRTRAWGIVAALSVTETVSWGILYYAFAVFLVPMQRGLGFSAAELIGAFSLAMIVSGTAGIAVGRYLDRHSPRALMTLASVAGALMVLAWSQVEGLAAFYAIWIAIGLVMAAVLYEPAFTVLAKHFPATDERRRAMTAMTLVAALASFIFMPLSQALIDAHGWRDALVVLAAILAAITVPLHALVLRPARPDQHAHTDARCSRRAPSARARRSAPRRSGCCPAPSCSPRSRRSPCRRRHDHRRARRRTGRRRGLCGAVRLRPLGLRGEPRSIAMAMETLADGLGVLLRVNRDERHGAEAQVVERAVEAGRERAEREAGASRGRAEPFSRSS